LNQGDWVVDPALGSLIFWKDLTNKNWSTIKFMTNIAFKRSLQQRYIHDTFTVEKGSNKLATLHPHHGKKQTNQQSCGHTPTK
jgi:hypothetical protein